jgi:predicted HTH transcriptional regulator
MYVLYKTAMTPEEFIALVAAGERPGIEFKGARARGDKNFNEVARAVMGMANQRDGGLIFIGVDKNGNVEGLSPTQVASWATADHVRETLAPCMMPRAYVDVESLTLTTGQTCVILTVHEFDLVPILCAKESRDQKGAVVLRQGACYVRSSHTPATTEIRDYPALRDLLDLAIEKGVREFVRRAQLAGLQIGATSTTTDADHQQYMVQQQSAFK